MKSSLCLLAFCCGLLVTACDSSPTAALPPPGSLQAKQVEAGCGRCLFDRKEDKKCNLAIRVDGQSYFVDGFKMRDFGNPDAEGGMCEAIHQAHVTGEIVDGRFAATQFDLIPSSGK